MFAKPLRRVGGKALAGLGVQVKSGNALGLQVFGFFLKTHHRRHAPLVAFALQQLRDQHVLFVVGQGQHHQLQFVERDPAPKIRIAGVGRFHATVHGAVSGQLAVILVDAQYLLAIVARNGFISARADVAHAQNQHFDIARIGRLRSHLGGFIAQ